METGNTVEMPTILVVDDTPDNLQFMSGILQPSYKVKVANSGERALKVLERGPLPDIMLLDVIMTGIDGYEVCRQMKANPATAAIPVIFLTARSEVEDETRGFESGAVDYITKPFIAAVTQNYVRALALKLQKDPRFARELGDGTISMLFKSAPLHDLGKVGIADSILLKPGRLTPEEFEVMKTHTTLGRDSIQHAEDALGLEVEFLKLAKQIAYSHQEKWDGSGYPQGLKGLEIPLSARLMAVADVYDALISVRVYKPAMSHEEAVDLIVKGRGSHFDPDLVDAFVGIKDEFQAIARKFSDDDRASSP